MMDTIKTKRLILRGVAMADAPDLYAMRAIPSVVQYTGVPQYTTLAQAEKYLDNLLSACGQGRCHAWMLRENTPVGAFVGFVCLWNKNHRANSFDIGYEQLPQMGGKGYMREAVEAVLAYAFSSLGLRMVLADPMEENLSSVHLLQHCGFALAEKGSGIRSTPPGHAMYVKYRS